MFHYFPSIKLIPIVPKIKQNKLFSISSILNTEISESSIIRKSKSSVKQYEHKFSLQTKFKNENNNNTNQHNINTNHSETKERTI